MPTYYLRTDLFNRPPVSPEQAARNRQAKQLAIAAGGGRNFSLPVKPREGRRGIFPLSRSAFHEWLLAGKIPPPDTVLGRRPVWKAETVHRALRDLGLPLPSDSQDHAISH